MSNVKNYGQSRVMYGAAAIRFFDDDVALFVLLHAGSAMRRDLLKPEPSIWLRDASGVRLDDHPAAGQHLGSHAAHAAHANHRHLRQEVQVCVGRGWR